MSTHTMKRTIDINGAITSQLVATTIIGSGLQTKINSASMSGIQSNREAAKSATAIIENAIASLEQELRRARNTLDGKIKRNTNKNNRNSSRQNHKKSPSANSAPASMGAKKKESTANTPAKKEPVKKTTTKKAPAKKTATKKAPAKKSPAKKAEAKAAS